MRKQLENTQGMGGETVAGNAAPWARNLGRGSIWAGVVLAAAALALSGCAGLAPEAPRANAVPGQILRDNMDYHGRFAVHYVDNNGQDRNVYGNFDLQQQAESETLQLLNPFGQTLARISVSPAGATLEMPDRPAQSAPAVETLMQQAIGFPLPMDGLRYWLKPEAAPGTPSQITKNPVDGRIKQILQDDWTIDYLAYDDVAANQAAHRPGNAVAGGSAPALKRVNLSRSYPPLDVKLVIDR